MGLEIDQSCNRPNSLFFTPRVAEGVETTEEGGDGLADILVLPGKAFDFEAVKLPPKLEKQKADKAAKADKPKAERSSGEQSTADRGEGFRTANMDRFLAICAREFRIAEWLGEIASEGVRHDYRPKIDHVCPLEDQHTDADDDDRAFYVQDGAGDAGGFQCFCQHQGCQERAKRADGKHDRGILFDALCAEHGVNDAAELLPWCSEEARAKWNEKKANPFEGHQEVPPGAGEQKPRKLLEYPSEISRAESLLRRANALVRGVLLPGQAAVMYAVTAAGKSFWAIDLAYHIAQGRPWHGRKVKKAPVLYVALEGVAGFRDRLIIASDVHGDPGKFFARLNVHISLVKDGAGEQGVQTIIDAAQELAAAAGQPVGLIVIDTLARAVPGSDENSVADMMAYIEKRLAVITAATTAATLTVHHPNKAGGFRGSTSMPGAFDVIFRIDKEKDAPVRSVVVEKNKDGIEGPLFDFELVVHELGRNEEGELETSCTIRSLPAGHGQAGGHRNSTRPSRRSGMPSKRSGRTASWYCAPHRMTVRSVLEPRCASSKRPSAMPMELKTPAGNGDGW